MRFLAFFLLATLGFAADAPHLYYSKFFKGSTPEFVAVTLDSGGAGTFRDAPDDPNPLQFQMTPEATAVIFDLAAKLDRFKRPLESGLKVAQVGIKTFRYEEGPEKHEVKFNYSIDPDAQALADWFEKVTETEEGFITLDRCLHFDKLGVNQALLEVEITYDHKRLVDRGQFLPLLDRITKNESVLHMARDRAAKLADEFRKPRETVIKAGETAGKE
jgi:hypothetical protein